MTILGVDPGLSGALVWFNPDDGLLEGVPMPTFKVERNGKKRGEIDHYKLANIVDERANYTKRAFIELVGSMPNQGVASAFTFGKVTGVALGIIVAHLIPLEQIAPGKWKRHMGVTADKDSCRRRASQLLPKYAHLWDSSTKDGLAEAALLAIYGSKL